MPNVRDSSGTIGTIRGPICLSRSSAASTRTNAIVVEISRSPVPSSWPLKVSSGGTGSGSARRRRAGSEPPSAARHSRRYCISGLSARRLVVLGGADLLVGERQLEAVAEAEQRRLGHLLGLVGDHLALAGDAHPVALDRLGQDHRRLAAVVDRLVVGGVDLLLVVAAAVEQPDLLVGHVRHPLGEHGVAAEEVLADVRAVARLERLVVAVDALVHHAQQPAVGIGGQQRIPAAAPDHLDDVPARAAEVRLELLDDLAVAADRPVEALEVAVDDPDQVVELLAAGQRGGAHRLGLVHLAVAEERPHLAPVGVGDPARLAGSA